MIIFLTIISSLSLVMSIIAMISAGKAIAQCERFVTIAAKDMYEIKKELSIKYKTITEKNKELIDR